MNEEFDIFNTQNKNPDGRRNYENSYIEPDQHNYNHPNPNELNIYGNFDYGPKRISWYALNKTQKYILGGLLCLGLLVIGYTAWQFKSTVEIPFPDFSSEQYDKNQPGQNQVNLAELQTKDTDNDNLSDYQELYVYKTSAYISDSDSDGISDYEEVSQGLDPNCPQGQNCFDPYAEYDDSILQSSTLVQNLGEDSDISEFNQGFISGDLSASELRNYLKQQGATDDMLNQVGDEELLEMYQSSLGEVKQEYEQQEGVDLDILETSDLSSNKVQPTDESVFNSQELDIEALKKMDGSELRQELLKLGISSSLLSSFDDETLKTTFLESLEKTIN